MDENMPESTQLLLLIKVFAASAFIFSLKGTVCKVSNCFSYYNNIKINMVPYN